ncbi:hypothetical protein MBLNU230_g0877t1 [Neophaeotheca triangularis]
MEGHLSHEEVMLSPDPNLPNLTAKPVAKFFSQLSSLLQKTQQTGHGAIHMTQKRLTYDPTTPSTTPSKVADDPLWDTHPPNPLPIIVRATDGKTRNQEKVKNKQKVKLSTVVQPDDLEAFFSRYAVLCKAEFQGLKKRDRSKRKKAKKGKKGDGKEEGEGAEVKG